MEIHQDPSFLENTHERHSTSLNSPGVGLSVTKESYAFEILGIES